MNDSRPLFAVWPLSGFHTGGTFWQARPRPHGHHATNVPRPSAGFPRSHGAYFEAMRESWAKLARQKLDAGHALARQLSLKPGTARRTPAAKHGSHLTTKR